MTATAAPHNPASAQPLPETPPAPDAAKLAKFRELALKRVPAAAKAIQVVGNLASRSYDWTPEMAEKIIARLESEIADLASALRKQTVAKKDEFDL